MVSVLDTASSATELESVMASLEELALDMGLLAMVSVLDTASSATELESVMASLVEPALAWVECTTATLATTALLSSTQLFLDKFIHSPARVISILSNETIIYFGFKTKTSLKCYERRILDDRIRMGWELIF